MKRSMFAVRAVCSLAAISFALPTFGKKDEMGSFGLGLRMGYTRLNLSAKRTPVFGRVLGDYLDTTNEAIDSYNAATGENHPYYHLSDMDLGQGLFEIAPSMHLGGDGYFAKLELPIGLSSFLKTVGLGIYPLNYGHYFPQSRLFPYASSGIIVSYAFSNKARPAISVSQKGALAEARLAIGMKYFAVDSMPVSLELGWSPYVLGAIADPDRADTPEGELPERPDAVARGGAGWLLNVRIGIDWL